MDSVANVDKWSYCGSRSQSKRTHLHKHVERGISMLERMTNLNSPAHLYKCIYKSNCQILVCDLVNMMQEDRTGEGQAQKREEVRRGRRRIYFMVILHASHSDIL